MMPTCKKIRVLVVDDSALVRSVLANGLSADPDIEVVGTAADPYQARDKLVTLKPDVMTLDVEMPRMDGISFLRRVMEVLPTPAVILSSLAQDGGQVVVEALEAGAVDVVLKPSAGVAGSLEAMMTSLIEKVKVAASTRVTPRAPARAAQLNAPADRLATTDAVIAIGASTGGVAALNRILPLFPAWTPGIVIVQHMPAEFTAKFAERLDECCAVRVSEAKHGDRVVAGHVLVAPGGNQQLEVRRYGSEYRIHLRAGELVSGHCPSVDVFFRSLAREVGSRAAACLLTGMGRDGAEGLLELRRAGGRTFAQDRESAAVWGMPAVALELGAVDDGTPLDALPVALVKSLEARSPTRVGATA